MDGCKRLAARRDWHEAWSGRSFCPRQPPPPVVAADGRGLRIAGPERPPQPVASRGIRGQVEHRSAVIASREKVLQASSLSSAKVGETPSAAGCLHREIQPVSQTPDCPAGQPAFKPAGWRAGKPSCLQASRLAIRTSWRPAFRLTHCHAVLPPWQLAGLQASHQALRQARRLAVLHGDCLDGLLACLQAVWLSFRSDGWLAVMLASRRAALPA